MKVYILKEFKSPRTGKIWKRGLINNVGNDWGKRMVKEGIAMELPDIGMALLYKNKAHWDAIADELLAQRKPMEKEIISEQKIEE